MTELKNLPELERDLVLKYVKLVRSGRRTLDSMPSKYRGYVEDEVERQDLAAM